jgi:hypothetical protein
VNRVPRGPAMIFFAAKEPGWGYYVVGLAAGHPMSVKPNPHNRLKDSLNLLMAVAMFLVMLLLFLRMVAFVVGHHTL